MRHRPSTAIIAVVVVIVVVARVAITTRERSSPRGSGSESRVGGTRFFAERPCSGRVPLSTARSISDERIESNSPKSSRIAGESPTYGRERSARSIARDSSALVYLSRTSPHEKSEDKVYARVPSRTIPLLA